MLIADRMGMKHSMARKIYQMALLHDIGKIGIDDAILRKPSRLTDEEFEAIKKHTLKGSEILSEITEMPELCTGARWHHERYDGKGYPDGLKGDEIPIEARIICVADSYDAMTSDRSYRKNLSQEKVRSEIAANIGIQFDPLAAKCMLDIIDDDKDFSLQEN
jgi:putative two-component system response regulator